MHLRAPNAWLFTVAAILVLIAILQYLGIPLVIPEIASLSIPRLSIPEVPAVLNVKPFWLMLLAWVLLAMGAVRWPRLFGRRSGGDRMKPAAA